MTGFSYSSKPVCFRAISMSFLNFLSKKPYPVNFQGQKLFETEIIKKSSIENLSRGTPICHLLKVPWILKFLDLEANIFRAFISLWCLPLVKISKKNPWDKGDMIQAFCIIWHRINPLTVPRSSDEGWGRRGSTRPSASIFL